MSSNFERLPEIINEAYAENFSILSQKLANPLLYLALHFLIGIPKREYIMKSLKKNYIFIWFSSEVWKVTSVNYPYNDAFSYMNKKKRFSTI